LLSIFHSGSSTLVAEHEEQQLTGYVPSLGRDEPRPSQSKLSAAGRKEAGRSAVRIKRALSNKQLRT
jgi:hypothetical protein